MGEISLSEKRGYGEQFDVEGLNFFRRLLAAIQNKEFVVFFQPKISISDMKISGAEALVRWYCDGSVLPPIKFIPFCERTGLV
ncbi:MAG: EAL domain-containing protein, partial [Lachnospiraceae bacterium]|nr:EAL domain-containing protein [Lachnospiraceae bacterium]